MDPDQLLMRHADRRRRRTPGGRNATPCGAACYSIFVFNYIITGRRVRRNQGLVVGNSDSHDVLEIDVGPAAMFLLLIPGRRRRRMMDRDLVANYDGCFPGADIHRLSLERAPGYVNL